MREAKPVVHDACCMRLSGIIKRLDVGAKARMQRHGRRDATKAEVREALVEMVDIAAILSMLLPRKKSRQMMDPVCDALEAALSREQRRDSFWYRRGLQICGKKS